MNKMTKRSLAFLLVLVICVALLPTFNINATAASSSTVDYVYNGKYIYNWGKRGEVATFLSPNAEDFYTGTNTYDSLSMLSGGTSTSNVPNSALYKALQNFMKGEHSHQTSYGETRDLYKYTDCQNSGGKISSFYSGSLIGPAWGEGSWNREHTWPNSKGLGGNDENDIMMLRPTATSENSSRGNTAYGQSSGYYHPNSESDGKYDLRGDVARIFLYVYVRWGNTTYAWGKSGVMESVDVMLDWMEADPVDTWELGRNDSVEAITGTRNVFVDYPEFAFLLFGESIPNNMQTPSGGAGSKCNHNNFDSGVVVAATCTTKGYTVFTCRTSGCGYSYQTNSTPAKGHSYANGVCSVCGESEPSTPTYATSITVGQPYKLGIFSADKNAEYYFIGSMSGYYGATDTDYTKGVDVYAETTTGGYRLYFMKGTQKQYINLVVSGTYRNFTFSNTATTVYTWDSAKSTFYTTLSGEICYIGTYGSYVTMGVLQSSKLKDTDYIARFYKMGGNTSGGNSGSGDTTCKHSYTLVVTVPTCTKEGYTTYTCTLCSDTYIGDKVSATGHKYTGDTCVDCGAKKPSESTLTISFSDTANRTSFSKTQQIWEQNGIKVTNDKASSNVDCANYSNPARFYAGSNLTISCENMIKLEINCAGLDNKYVKGWLEVIGATATNNNGIITVEFASPVDSLTYTGLSAQSRAYSITVYTAGSVTQCDHAKTETLEAVSATCTTDGHTGKIRCVSCGEIVSYGSIIPAKGHTEVSHEAKAPTCTTSGWSAYVTCENCGYTTYAEVPATGHSIGEWRTIKASTCTEKGTEVRECIDCGYSETRDIPAGHDWVEEDGYKFCASCGDVIEYENDDDNPNNNGDGSFMDMIMNLIETIMNAINDIIEAISDMFS